MHLHYSLLGWPQVVQDHATLVLEISVDGKATESVHGRCLLALPYTM